MTELMGSDTMLIEVKNLTRTYHNDHVATPALQGVSFTIENGEFIAIMGPSGSGKSTLLHILGFLDTPTRGEYCFEGKTMRTYTQKERANIRNKKMGFVFQTFNLLPRTTVLENVELPLLYSAVPEKEWGRRARAAIDAVGLTHRMGHDPSQLSGGEKQRAAIARALVNDPQVIFADEPTGNLDSQSGKMVMDFLLESNENGRTVVLITHEQYTAQYAQRIIHLKDGVIEKEEKVTTRKTSKDEFEK